MGEHLLSIGAISEALGTSVSNVRLLANSGVIPSHRTAGGHRRFDLIQARRAWERHRSTISPTPLAPPATAATRVDMRLPLDGLGEHQVWLDVQSAFEVGERARIILRHGFTEMLNNAIDHSEGSTARVAISSIDDVARVVIEDDGIGAFERLARGLQLDDPFDAVVELTKGKRTTDPERHAGEGIFFTSKAVDRFELAANGIAWSVDNLRDDQAVGTSDRTVGTRVTLEIDANTARDLTEVFRSFTLGDDDDFAFSRSRPRVRLAQHGESFVSRSEAKRILAGLERFLHVELDFADVTSVGQGFVDEVFRVWPTSHPGTTIEPRNMNDAVRFMVTRGLPRSAP